MEKGNFEKAWKEAFDGAEVAPSDAVWANVELGLEKSAGGRMRQRLLFYKVLAAASLVFAMGIGGAYYLAIQHNPPASGRRAINQSSVNEPGGKGAQTTIVQADNSTELNEATDKNTVNSKEDTSLKMDVQAEIRNAALTNNKYPTLDDKYGSSKSTHVLAVDTKPTVDGSSNGLFENGFYTRIADRFTERPLPLLVKNLEPKLVVNKPYSEPDLGMQLLAQLNAEEKKYAATDKRRNTENIWTSLGVGAGSFNPNTNSSVSVNNSLSSGSNQSPSANAGPSAGSSYSLGLQVGGRIADRFVLQGGLSYLSQNASYVSTVVSGANYREASLNDFSNNQSLSYASTPYGVNSNLQFISLPVQAGYLVIDRDFSIQLNGGVSTDFFILNTLTPDAPGINKTTQGAGADSPYRNVNFSGLAGTEFSYKFSDHYRIAINPGMRYALNSIYKSDANAEVAPITFDVSLRFRYIFR
ncbi:MAG: hypothetical protein KF725_07050 [Cyclobacteriaceae bacterium]|nr:hypothetical protein [Cyclobacteriaceae bacterium]UYN88318.1 MAG: hypothetical protein KIT51_08760 [Cyclobacteriaceae bacterium]